VAAKNPICIESIVIGVVPLLSSRAYVSPLGVTVSCPRLHVGNAGAFDPAQVAVYQDNMQPYSTTEPAIDLTATSFLMWSWRLAGLPSF